MKSAFSLLGLAVGSLLLCPLAHAGHESSGGGDLCEDRIKEIRDDIQSWIDKGGAQGLTLPQGVSLSQYTERMSSQIKTARIKCVGAGDRDYPVTIEGTPKVCKFTKDSGTSQITCDYTKLLTSNASDQYVLIHHEYAGLAGIELPNGSDSHYETSNQISGYLEDQLVKKLVVKSQDAAPVSYCRYVHTQNLPLPPVGFHCQTRQGYTFELVSRDGFAEAWKAPDGLIWSEIKGDTSYEKAAEICKSSNAMLPEVTDFQNGDRFGLSDVLPGMKQRFWTSTEFPYDAEIKNAFDGDTSDTIVEPAKKSHIVRCVGR